MRTRLEAGRGEPAGRATTRRPRRVLIYHSGRARLLPLLLLLAVVSFVLFMFLLLFACSPALEPHHLRAGLGFVWHARERAIGAIHFRARTGGVSWPMFAARLLKSANSARFCLSHKLGRRHLTGGAQPRPRTHSAVRARLACRDKVASARARASE